jgi:hypothetical protein
MRNKIASWLRIYRSSPIGILAAFTVIVLIFRPAWESLAGDLAVFVLLYLFGPWVANKICKSPEIEYAENGTVSGYKVLKVERGVLLSPIFHYCWKVGWNKKDMRWVISPGFYAFREIEDAVFAADQQFMVPVKVELAGKIDVCEKGYRAEYARIVGILPSWFAGYTQESRDYVTGKLGYPIVEK